MDYLGSHNSIPKSGILLANALSKLNIGETALDIGTGETGFLAYYLLSKGANKIVACDIDQEAINHAQTASLNNSHIIWKVSDVYSNLPNLKFDLIVSNPPQMPMSNPGQPHDYGGIDGRDIILNIIKKSRQYLNLDGKIVFLCFDFLGVTERFNSSPSIAEIANKSGFRCKVIEKHKRI